MNELARFFRGYLHEDYDIDYKDSQEAAEAFGSHEPLDAVCMAIGEGMVLLEKYDSSEIERWLPTTGCAYRPYDRPSTAHWLREVLGQIVRAAAQRQVE